MRASCCDAAPQTQDGPFRRGMRACLACRCLDERVYIFGKPFTSSSSPAAHQAASQAAAIHHASPCRKAVKCSSKSRLWPRLVFVLYKLAGK